MKVAQISSNLGTGDGAYSRREGWAAKEATENVLRRACEEAGGQRLEEGGSHCRA